MRLDINLATQPYEDGRRFWMRWGPVLGGAGLITLGLAITAISSWAAARKDQVQISNFQDQIAKCEQERAKAQEVLDRPQNRSTRDQSQFINGLIRRKAFSWTQVFSDLERMMPPELHVTSIHPELSKDNQLQIKLSVAGKSRERALQLVHHMEQSRRFLQPRVEEENATRDQGGDVFHFEIASIYIPEVDLTSQTSDAEAEGAPCGGPNVECASGDVLKGKVRATKSTHTKPAQANPTMAKPRGKAH